MYFFKDVFVYCISFLYNVFFFYDLAENFKIVKPSEAWVNSQFSETRNENGQLTFISREDRIKLLADMPIINTDDGKKYLIKEVL